MSGTAATTPAAAVECAHGEPRGCASCPLCARYGCKHCLQVDEPVIGPTVVFTTRLPADLHAALKAKAKAEDRRASQTVRAALRAYLQA